MSCRAGFYAGLFVMLVSIATVAGRLSSSSLFFVNKGGCIEVGQLES